MTIFGISLTYIRHQEMAITIHGCTHAYLRVYIPSMTTVGHGCRAAKKKQKNRLRERERKERRTYVSEGWRRHLSREIFQVLPACATGEPRHLHFETRATRSLSSSFARPTPRTAATRNLDLHTHRRHSTHTAFRRRRTKFSVSTELQEKKGHTCLLQIHADMNLCCMTWLHTNRRRGRSFSHRRRRRRRRYRTLILAPANCFPSSPRTASSASRGSLYSTNAKGGGFGGHLMSILWTLP